MIVPNLLKVPGRLRAIRIYTNNLWHTVLIEAFVLMRILLMLTGKIRFFKSGKIWYF